MKLITAAICIVLSGCATQGAQYRPIIDSARVDPAQYARDLAECQGYATQTADAAQSAAAGAIAGAVLGALLGAVAGGNRYQRNTISAIGALDGAVSGGVSGEVNQRNIIRRCLANRGYSVLQ